MRKAAHHILDHIKAAASEQVVDADAREFRKRLIEGLNRLGFNIICAKRAARAAKQAARAASQASS